MREVTRSCLLLCVLGCGSSTVPPQKAASSFSVEVQLYVQRAGKRIEVPPGGTVHSQEVFDLEVTPSQPAYLYVGLQHADGAIDVLFPDRNEQVLVSQGKLDVGGASSGDELSFDEATGTERLVVVASVRPLSEADEASHHMIFVADEEPAVVVDAGVAAPTPVDAVAIDAGAPVEAKRVAKTTYRPKYRTSAITAKGVVRRKKHPVIDANADNIVIYPYEVQHTP